MNQNKTKYRVANWPAYNRALVRRGDVTVWLSFRICKLHCRGEVRNTPTSLDEKFVKFCENRHPLLVQLRKANLMLDSSLL